MEYKRLEYKEEGGYMDYIETHSDMQLIASAARALMRRKQRQRNLVPFAMYRFHLLSKLVK